MNKMNYETIEIYRWIKSKFDENAIAFLFLQHLNTSIHITDLVIQAGLTNQKRKYKKTIK